MSESNDARAKHREHIERRTELVRGKRGPVSFVWGNHIVKPRQRVPGAPGLWSPLPEGEPGLLVEAAASDGIVIDGRKVEGSAKLMADPDHPASVAYFHNGAEGVIFKTRITCTVNATLDLTGALQEGPLVGPGPVVRSSQETRSQMGGVTTTWYTPLDGRAGAPCHRASYYWGSITLRASGGTIGATNSDKVKLTCP